MTKKGTVAGKAAAVNSKLSSSKEVSYSECLWTRGAGDCPDARPGSTVSPISPSAGEPCFITELPTFPGRELVLGGGWSHMQHGYETFLSC
ncbi:hypothetical protein SKAU_G00172870 [Synaphobranchus kaupii]|uniref:Uncharacterized protein n=1 Tax=Synaphobranchus kaupii TaxID=118154 RepID=A0A9Q1FL98_SYNKA|nr:hypothetical protein SKAU_G00172870 [Synaphobranchus kaupii]